MGGLVLRNFTANGLLLLFAFDAAAAEAEEGGKRFTTPPTVVRDECISFL